MGNAKNSLHHKAIDFIKKNEGYRDQSYKDRKNTVAICWGNRYLENGDLVKHISKFSKARCEKLIYTHFYKRVLPKIPKGLSDNRFIVIADTLYQFGSNVSIKRIKSYPERGRERLWYETN